MPMLPDNILLTQDRMYCPCCRKDVPMRYFEALLVDAVDEMMPRKTRAPRRVLCVTLYGVPLKEGYARTYRCHAGVVDVGILPEIDSWKHGWWWPLDRVLWEIEKEPN